MDNMPPNFKISTNFTTTNISKRAPNTITVSYSTSAYSSTGGPLFVKLPNYGNPINSYAQSGFKNAGFPVSLDFSSGSLNGSIWTRVANKPEF